MSPKQDDSGQREHGLNDDGLSDVIPAAPAPQQSADARDEAAQPIRHARAPATPTVKKQRKRFAPRSSADSGLPLEEWTLSYSDMVTLLLTMFVALSLIVSYDERPGPGGGRGGQPQAGQGPGEGGAPSTAPSAAHGMRAVIENLLQMKITSPYGDEPGFTAVEVNDAATPEPSENHELAVIKSQDLERIRQRQEALANIRTKLKAQQLDQFITADVEGDGIRLNIPNSILFASGAAELQGRGPAVLRAMKPVLEGAAFGISVEGHTDNVPIGTDKFPSNWELSAQRAAAVVRALVDAGIAPGRLEAVGYADTRPLASNDTEDGRRENRRVSLFLRM